MSEVKLDEIKTQLEDKVISLLKVLDLDVKLESKIQNNRLYFNVEGTDTSCFFYGKDDPLKSISILLQTYCEKVHPGSNLEIRFDVNREVDALERELKEEALAACEGLTKDGDEITLEPLNSFERRIVHMALRDVDHIETQSLGNGHLKPILIRFKAAT